ncbi:MAG: NAD-dependent epimerase/dehydratase family protein [Candidatus Omnitrophica bacterium]|jgi:UDP-glucose 4-epimerase|nr:NAD-dependent epimerase/dehydratase family protein [Candidatus Omnitrophota bacterium]
MKRLSENILQGSAARFWRGRKCVVTGGAGFIGSHLVCELVRLGARVTVVDDLSTGKRSNLAGAPGVRLIRADINGSGVMQKALAGSDTVFHLAAVASVQQSIEDPIGTHEVNATGALRVFAEAAKAGARKVVYASSAAVYGDADASRPLREEDAGTTLSFYAEHKALNERYARLCGKMYGLRTAGLRFFNVYGPRQDPSSPYSGVISIFTSKMAAGETPLIFGDGGQTRDFVFVADVVQALLLAAGLERSTGRVYNVASGRPMSVNQLAARIAAVLEKNIKPLHKPARAGDIRHSQASIARITRELGYRPRVKSEDGLRITVEWAKGSIKGMKRGKK